MGPIMAFVFTSFAVVHVVRELFGGRSAVRCSGDGTRGTRVK